MEWIEEVLSQVMNAINQGNITALVALFFIVVLTEMGIPFPFILDAALFFTSYQSGIISGQVGIVFLVVFVGRQFGSGLLYWLTRLPGNVFINWLGRRFPSIPRGLTKIETRLGKDAILAIAIARLSSLLTVASVASGAIGLRYYYLVLGVALSAVIFDGVLLLLGSGIGVFLPHLPPWIIVIGLIVLLAIVWGVHLAWVRRKPRSLTNT
jgi:membrane protein DedA with SNARE-associated domain